MWLPSGLNLSPAECRVFAYIYGLTESKHSKTKGYNGSVRQLAKDLGLSLGKTSDALRKLQGDNRITLTDGVYMSVQLMNDSVQLVNESVQLVNPLNNPHKEINKEMERNNIIARDTIATPNSQTLFSFYEFLSAYRAATNTNVQYSDETLADARNLWDALKPWKQKQLLRALDEGTWSKPRLDWTITDYHFREPMNYAGKEIPSGLVLYRAKFEDQKGIYTEQDVRDFDMTDAKFFMNA